MRIAFVNATKKWGGVKTWCLDMGGALQEQGHEVWIYGRDRVFIERAHAMGLRAERVEFGLDFNVALIGRFVRHFRRDRVDRVVVNVGKDVRSAGIAARILGIPVVQHLGGPGDLRNTFKIRLTQRLIRPRLVACSEFVRRELVTSVPLLRRYDFVAIHPGVVSAETPAASNGPERVILSTSRLDPDKGHAQLLDALAALVPQALPFRVVVLGVGSEESRLRRRAEALGIADRIRWEGFHPDVRPFLQQADIFVLPSFCEPLGIALQEAMAYGLVPVARRAGGVPEIWPAGMESLLFGDAEGGRGLHAVLSRVVAAADAELFEWKRRTLEHARIAFDLRQQGRLFADWMQAAEPSPTDASGAS
ncbi:MAG: glycosyltransferase [Candidatus Latescibacterota bacterium]|nr:MAG: glycosyltransferase [Candidatus Latescibacterota bacterium]